MEERRKHTTCPLDEDVHKLTRVMFGDKELGEIGMHDMVKEMYSIVTGAKNLIKMLDTFGGILKWGAGIGLAIALFKGWILSLIAYLIGSRL